MPQHQEKRVLPYSRDKVFDLVADIEKYPEFLPWCIGLRILKREENIVHADLMVGFKMIREKFTSRVTLNGPERIDVEYLDGPFQYLKNNWVFRDHPDGCEVDFFIDFEFRSRLLRKVMQPLFHEAVRRMVGAFETRARKLYGPPQGIPSPSRA